MPRTKKSETKEEKTTKRVTKKLDQEKKDNKDAKERLLRVRNDTSQIIAKSFSQKLPEFLAQRKDDFERVLEEFNLRNEIQIEAKSGKVSHYKLSATLSKPLLVDGIAPSKLTAYDISMLSRCYWECVEEACNTVVYIPTIYQFCSMIGISTQTFVAYKAHPDRNIREAVQMVYDKFIDYYTTKGMTNEINSIMGIFAMKAQYGLRDNEPTQVVVNNNTQIAPQTYLDDLQKKYDVDVVDVDSLEV